MDPRWKHPFTAVIAGPTGCGKSYFVKQFLLHLQQMVDTPISEVIWCYAEWQPLYDTIQNHRVRFHQGLPQLEDFVPQSGPKLVILDDMMREADERVVDLFTKGSHHRNLSVMFLSQNIFHQGKGRRDISLNAHYVVCFKNPRDRAQIAYLARQVYPENPAFIQEAYQDATSRPHGYLVLDFKQSTPDIERVRTAIFPSDTASYVYLPKKAIKHRHM
jgi:hypothetical protein